METQSELVSHEPRPKLSVGSPEFIPSPSYQSSHMVNYGAILGIVSRLGGEVLDQLSYDLKYIDSASIIRVQCKHKHSWTTPVAQVRQWCNICKILKEIHRINSTVYAVVNEFDVLQIAFEFKCSLGHWFIGDMKKTNRGCIGCDILMKAIKKHAGDLMIDQHSLIANSQSRIRMHCYKYRHDPLCKNPVCREIITGKVQSLHRYDPLCKNFAMCNQDFYATPAMLLNKKDIYICEHDHTWKDNWEIINTVRLFEIHFDQRFDDPLIDPSTKSIINVTGYNASLGIAFTHMSEKKSAIAVDRAEKFCNHNKIKFIEVPSNIVKSSKLAVYIFEELEHLDAISKTGGVTMIVNKTRARMRLMSASHKLLDTRTSNVDDKSM